MHARDALIQAPCDEDWEGMEADVTGQRRFCERCREQVHDLSALDERSARAFLSASEGFDVCISYVVDARGQLEFARRPPPRLVELRRPSQAPRPARPLAAASFTALLAACTPHGEAPQPLELEVENIELTPVSEPRPVIPLEAPRTPPRAKAPPPAQSVEDTLPPQGVRTKGGRRRTAGVRFKRHDPLG